MIELALRRQVSTFVATVALSALGLFSLARLPLALLPEVERPRLVVEARAASSSRDELLHDVTGPIERRLALVPGIASIDSETRDGEVRITLEAVWQADPDRLRVDVARRIEGASAVPLDELSVDVAGTDVAPVIEVAVAGASGATRTIVAQRVVMPELGRIDGAGRIDLVGASPLRLVVQPRAADLAARNLTALDVEERLRSVGRPMAAGRVREGAAVRPVVVVQPVHSTDDLRTVTIGAVPLGEVADVALREVPDVTAFRMAGLDGGGLSRSPSEEAVLLRVHRAPKANAVALARAVRERVEELGRRTGDVKLRLVSDRSREVSRALVELALSALLGILLGTLVLRFMLGRWRPTVALAVVIPVALLVSFTVFYFAGISLDVISLAGLALATGLLVDNSIVVLESIDTARAAGRTDAVLVGTRQIVVAVVASSITLMIVFAPLLYLRGLARALFAEQALAVVASVGASLLFSLTLTPVLSSRGGEAGRRRSPGLAAYLRFLDRALDRPRPLLWLAAVVVVAGLALAALLPRELFARGSAREVVVELTLPGDLDSTAARALGLRLWRSAASALNGLDLMAMSMVQREGGDAEIDVQLRSAAAASAAAAALQRGIRVPGVSQDIRLRSSAFVEDVAGDASRIELVASAITERDAASLETRIVRVMERAGFRRRDSLENRPANAVTLEWNDRLLAANGTTRAALEPQVRAALGEVDAGECDLPGVEKSILLLPVVPPDLGLLPVRLGDRVVPLGAVAASRPAREPPLALHDQGRPARRLLFDRTADADAADVLSRAGLRRGERVRLAGHQREMGDAFAQMRLAFVLAVALLYLTIAAFYDSLVLPLLVMTAIPFAAAGAVVALLVTGQSLNVMSLIGLTLLGGIVVNHTVVLLDRAEQLRRQGAGEARAIRAAAAERYRPVIMTTATAILGMLPLALAGGEGVELRRAIAVAVIGGLITATAGTLALIPLLHAAVDPWRRRGPQHVPQLAAEPQHA